MWNNHRFFYLRTLMICASKFLNDELDNVENSFTQLQYLKSFIQCAKIKKLLKFTSINFFQKLL